MATVEILPCRKSQTGAGLSAVLAYCMREDKTMLGERQLVSGVNCVPEAAFIDMMNTKMQYRKTDGKMYYHMVQSFSPSEKITPELAHQIAVEFAQQQLGEYEVVVSTHVDAKHIHSHFVWNSVSCENGRKYHSDSGNIQRLRDASDALCLKYGLTVVGQKKGSPPSPPRMSPREYQSAMRGENWKLQLAAAIDDCMRLARTKADFIRLMEYEGYGVLWTDERKYITYTTPNGMKCRDRRLYESKYSKEMMEDEFRIRGEIAAGAERDCPTAEAADKSGGGTAVHGDYEADSCAARCRQDAGGNKGKADNGAESGSSERREPFADGHERRRITGWEDCRKSLEQPLHNGGASEAVYRTADVDIPDTFGGGLHLGSALASLAVGFSGSPYDDEDPEERRRRIEAEQNAQALSEVMDTLAEIIDEHAQEDVPYRMGGI